MATTEPGQFSDFSDSKTCDLGKNTKITETIFTLLTATKTKKRHLFFSSCHFSGKVNMVSVILVFYPNFESLKSLNWPGSLVTTK